MITFGLNISFADFEFWLEFFFGQNFNSSHQEEITLKNVFKLSLHKLLLYKTGAFCKPHRDSEKEPGMFGTLTIQLPSKYEGGQLIVNHMGRSERVDFNSAKEPDNEFSTFFAAFNADCEHEVLPVTNGIRVCLVYDMLSAGTNATNVPQLPSSTNIARLDSLKFLLNDWTSGSKLVYCFDHQYTESNLCFNNLKSTDYQIARLFKNFSHECSLEIMFGLLKKEPQGYGSDFDSEDDDARNYELACLKSMDNEVYVHKMEVNFDDEVIPDNCFESVSPNDKKDSNTGYCGVEVTCFYYLAAMVIFKRENVIHVLSGSRANASACNDIFLREYEKFQGGENDPETKNRILSLAKQIAGVDSENSIELLQALASFNDVSILQTYLTHHVLGEDTIPLLIAECQKFGYQSFSGYVIHMFSKMLDCSTEMKLLEILIDNEPTTNMDGVKLQVLHTCFSETLKKYHKPERRSFSNWYVRPPTREEIQLKVKETQNVLYSMWLLADKMSYNIAEYTKTKPIEVAAPVLYNLALDMMLHGNSIWLDAANYFVIEMQKILALKIPQLDWRRTVQQQRSCNDCFTLINFLHSDEQSMNLQLSRVRRLHLHQQMNSMQHLSHETDRRGAGNMMVIIKTQKVFQEEFDRFEVATQFLPKLRTFIQSAN